MQLVLKCLPVVLCGFAQEMPKACADHVCTGRLLSPAVGLLELTQSKALGCNQTLSVGGPVETPPTTPKWLSPLLLLLDVWEKTLAVAEWTRPPKKACLGCAVVCPCY